MKKINECLKREDIFKYATKKISDNEKRRIEQHLYGDEIGTDFDKDLGVKVRLHRYNGCVICLKILTEINESPDVMLSKHIV